jgi:plastocyanin
MMKYITLFVLMAVALPAGQAMAQPATPITITLTNYAFQPDALTLKPGVTYQMHFINGGSKDHNFSAPEFFAVAQVAAEDQAKIRKGAVAVSEGQSVDITVTPATPGTYPVICTHFMHKMMGMHGSILVQ